MKLSRRGFLAFTGAAVAAAVVVPVAVEAKAEYNVILTADGGFAKTLWPGINAMFKAEYDSSVPKFPALFDLT